MEAKADEMKLTEKPKAEVIDVDITKGIMPHSYKELLQFAALYKNSGLAPKSFQTVEQVAIGVGMCLELDRPILTGLQDMAVINGRVGIFGDATLAIIRSSGLLETFEQWEEGKPYSDDWIIYTKVKRKGMNEKTDYWSWLDSKKAGFDDPRLSQSKGGGPDKFSPWTRFTRRMMYFKSRNFLLRDEFGDILKGMNTVEELQEYIDVTPEAGPALKIEGEEKPNTDKDVYDVKKKEEEPPPDMDSPGGPIEDQGENNPPPEGLSLLETIKKMRPTRGEAAMAEFKKVITQGADMIRAMPPEDYQYVTEKWTKCLPGEEFPAKPLSTPSEGKETQPEALNESVDKETGEIKDEDPGKSQRRVRFLDAALKHKAKLGDAEYFRILGGMGYSSINDVEDIPLKENEILVAMEQAEKEQPEE